MGVGISYVFFMLLTFICVVLMFYVLVFIVIHQ